MGLAGLKSNLYLAKYSLLKPGAAAAFRLALRNERLSADELEALHWSRLRGLLDYAYRKTRYYRRRFDEAGLRPDDLRLPGDFAAVPVLTRQDLHDHFQDLVSVEARPRDLNLVTTGGSTGRPAKVYHQRNVPRAAMLWQMESWWNLPPGTDYATVYREPDNWKHRLVSRAIDWPVRRVFMDATHLDAGAMDRFLARFNRVRPPLLHGYVGAVDHLAAYVLEGRLTVHAPQAIWLTSSPTTAVQERRIQRAFGAPVFDQYGCCEVYYLAAQCPAREGLHRFHDSRRIEFLGPDHRPVPDGAYGDIALTDLHNRLFPIIRYLNGDQGRARPGQCPCGRTLPLMDKIRGRVSDLLRLPSGRCIAGDYLTTLFDDCPDAVRQFQVYQRKDHSIEIRVVPNPAWPRLEETLARVRSNLADKGGQEVPVTVMSVPEIPPRGGKLRYVLSEVAAPGPAMPTTGSPDLEGAV